MSWKYQNKELKLDEEEVKKYAGFVYLITNKIDGRKYVGKKLFWFTRKKLVKGKSKRVKYESDWRDYWSSSDELKEDVKRLGEENFEREILHLVKTKGSASYFEAKEQFLREVLEKPDEWYNGQIRCRVHRSHVKL